MANFVLLIFHTVLLGHHVWILLSMYLMLPHPCDFLPQFLQGKACTNLPEFKRLTTPTKGHLLVVSPLIPRQVCAGLALHRSCNLSGSWLLLLRLIGSALYFPTGQTEKFCIANNDIVKNLGNLVARKLSIPSLHYAYHITSVSWDCHRPP